MFETAKPFWASKQRSVLEQWPNGEDGTPEKAEFLTHSTEVDGAADLLVEKLAAYQIPAVKKYEKEGTLGKVILGFSGYGVALYVPQSLLEDAKNLIAPVSENEMEDAQ